ncbi:MAG: hypothetical protein E7646_09275 [Ruminococcaceae bacterium]|nr:hypothetical protein [Oscillospiraceae bacterium]
MKNALKALICCILILSLGFSSVFTCFSEEEISSITPPSGVYDIRTRLSGIMEIYPDQSYFTDDGKACTHHFNCHSSEGCNCKEVTSEEAGTAGNMQCFGFARYVFFNVFGISYPHFNTKSPWAVNDEEEKKNVIELWSYAPLRITADMVKGLFEDCRVGDILQWGLPHSMVVVEVNTDGVLVYDANYDLHTCQVLLHLIDWRTMTKYMNTYGASLYRAANYPEASRKATGRVINEPFKAISYFSEDLYGLELFCDLGKEQYTLTSLENGAWRISDGLLFDKTVEAGSEDAFSVGISILGRGEKGSLSLSFLNKMIRIPVTVHSLPELLEYSPPEKLEYIRGEDLSCKGAWIRYINSEGYEKTVFSDDINFSCYDKNSLGEQLVTASYDGVCFSYTVKVAPEESIENDIPLKEKRDPQVLFILIALSLVIVLCIACAYCIQKDYSKQINKKIT